MNKSILVIVTISTIFLMNGCGVGKVVDPKIQTKSKKDFHISQMNGSDGDYMVSGGNTRVLSGYDVKSKEAAEKKRVVFKDIFEAAAIFTKKQGYSHFVITNPGYSNIVGFPINNFNEFIRYITLEDRKTTFDTIGPYQENSLIRRGGHVEFYFMPVGSKVVNSGLVSTWKVSDFI